MPLIYCRFMAAEPAPVHRVQILPVR
ncbi:uncharacterized protein METZ01_LOCUS72361 [marine metagenome]|uniref:Uncharacterized protein n=1 Tax=marine metagenome TaxID=408172 RepID=A0A381TX08_9ZZZZ